MMVAALGGRGLHGAGAALLGVRELDRHRPGPRRGSTGPRAGGRREPARTPLPAHRRAGARRSCPPLPWHYSGDLLTVEYRTDPARHRRAPARGRRRSPTTTRTPARSPSSGPTGRAAATTAPSSLDPVRAQYRRPSSSCAAATRGQLCQPLPVHLGRQGLRAGARPPPGLPEEARLDPPVPPGDASGAAGPRLEPGGRFGMTLAAERPAPRRGDGDARAGPRRRTASSTRYPCCTTAGSPRIELDGTDSLAEVVTMSGVDVELGPACAGDADARAVRLAHRGADLHRARARCSAATCAPWAPPSPAGSP